MFAFNKKRASAAVAPNGFPLISAFLSVAATSVTLRAFPVDPVIEVELPGDLAFGINPLSLDADDDGTADDQIVTSQYMITNYSNVPVLINN